MLVNKLNTSRKWGLRMPTQRAVVKIRWGLAWHIVVLAKVSHYEVIAVLSVGGPSSPAISLLWHAADYQHVTWKWALKKASHGPWWKQYPPIPRSKYLQSHLTTAPLHLQGSLKWHGGSRMHKHKSQLASSILSTSTPDLPSQPLDFLVPFTWSWVITYGHAHSLPNPFLIYFNLFFLVKALREVPLRKRSGTSDPCLSLSRDIFGTLE